MDVNSEDFVITGFSGEVSYIGERQREVLSGRVREVQIGPLRDIGMFNSDHYRSATRAYNVKILGGMLSPMKILFVSVSIQVAKALATVEMSIVLTAYMIYVLLKCSEVEKRNNVNSVNHNCFNISFKKS